MITGYKPSQHLLNDRESRFLKIATTIGIGDKLDEFPHPTRAERKIIVTTTGVVCIVAEKSKTIITLYAADINLIIALYKGNVPCALRNKITHSMKKYPELWTK